MCRRKSPSVKTPASFPFAFTTLKLPDFARVADGRIVYDVGATPSLALPERGRR